MADNAPAPKKRTTHSSPKKVPTRRAPRMAAKKKVASRTRKAPTTAAAPKTQTHHMRGLVRGAVILGLLVAVGVISIYIGKSDSGAINVSATITDTINERNRAAEEAGSPQRFSIPKDIRAKTPNGGLRPAKVQVSPQEDEKRKQAEAGSSAAEVVATSTEESTEQEVEEGDEETSEGEPVEQDVSESTAETETPETPETSVGAN